VLRPSKSLELRLRTLRAFRDAYAEAVRAAAFYETALGGGYYGAPEDAEAEFIARLSRLSQLAGRALEAAGDDRISVSQFGMTHTPLLQWRDPFTYDGGHTTAEMLLDTLDATIGILEERFNEAKTVERTLAFRLGWFFTFAQRARDSAGASRGAQRAAFAGAIAAQVVAGLVVAGIIAAAGLLVR